MAKTEERRTDPSAGKSGASPGSWTLESRDSADSQPDNSEEMAGATLVSHVVESDVAHELPGRWTRVARRAYQLAEERGFAPGAQLDDWLRAETEIDGESTAGRQFTR